MSDLRAITLWQPRATLVAEKVKWIETRLHRYPWDSAIGDVIGIHAAVRPIRRGAETCALHDAADTAGVHSFYDNRWYVRTEAAGIELLPFGAMVATARLIDVIPMVAPGGDDDLPFLVVDADDTLTVTYWGGDGVESPACLDTDVSDQYPYGGFAPGRWALLLGDVKKLREPVYNIGGGTHQGLWSVPPADVTRIEEAA